MQRSEIASCISPPDEAPPTPEKLKKFRKSFKQQVGVPVVHPGYYNDPHPEVYAFGTKTAQCEKVEVLMKPALSGVAALVNDVKEDRYLRHKKEPLGRPASRGYDWPSHIHENFQFGSKVKGNEFSGKECVFPPDTQKERPETAQMYKKTHGTYEPGEQKQRDYEWKNMNPQDHRFGKVEKRQTNQMLQIIQQTDGAPITPTTIVKKNYEDHRNYHYDHFGKPKNLAQNANNETPFGMKKKQDEWGVGQIISGSTAVDPDKDLGRTNKPGYRNVVRAGDENRVFGVPTIRSDISRQSELKSVANNQNYGDEKPAVQLLFPEKYSDRGLDQHDFQRLRPKAEIKSIFESIGYVYKIGKFEGIYRRAKEIQGNDEKVSVRAFQKAVEEMHHID